MQRCINAINVGGWEELLPSTVMPLEVKRNTPQVFYINSTQPRTAIFNFVFSPVGSTSNYKVTVTAIHKQGDKYVSIGSAEIRELFGSFSKEFQTGEYFLCVSSTHHFTGTVTTIYQGFSQEARFRMTLGHGEALSQPVLTLPRKPQHCDEALYFRLLEGKLPPGIRLTDLGILLGRLPNVDCLEDSEDYSPGMNWSYEDECGRMNPWGRQWRFKVRVSVAGQDDEYKDDEWFCIQIHNDWSLDRDNFLKNFPFKNVREVEVLEVPEPLPELCYTPCVEPIDTSFKPEEIKEQLCPICDSADVVTDVVLIPIPQDLCEVPVNAMATWWMQNKDTTFDCKAVNDFIQQLKESDYFQLLLAQAGLPSTQSDSSDVVVEASAYQNFLQLTASTLIDGRNESDLDYQMLQWKLYQNKKLPMTVYMHHGHSMDVGDLHVN